MIQALSSETAAPARSADPNDFLAPDECAALDDQDLGLDSTIPLPLDAPSGAAFGQISLPPDCSTFNFRWDDADCAQTHNGQ